MPTPCITPSVTNLRRLFDLTMSDHRRRRRTVHGGERKSIRERRREGRTIGRRRVKPPAVGRLRRVRHGFEDAAVESVDHDVAAPSSSKETEREWRRGRRRLKSHAQAYFFAKREMKGVICKYSDPTKQPASATCHALVGLD
jgi:hypothetical protein